ncbi:MAG: nucleotidyl transferase AbiEii/AbiGii toxin family protein [Desulfobacterales bacterium]|nr:nucleotidyl transferase AbiEii/AbiGii toxin family protein [Desulfobacterales bacterium]
MSDKQVDLRKLVNLGMEKGGQIHMRPVIEKELLHYDILFALDRERLLDKLTFQGGTSLRLCYGAVRYSEDLDFVGGYDFTAEYLMAMKSCIEHYIGSRYGLEVVVKEPKDMALEEEFRDIHVDKWQIIVVTSPGQRHIPKQKIKIEVANIPAYSQEPYALQNNYDFLPDGYADTIVLVESLNEIMADKLVSLVNCQAYIRYRDIWDLRWLKTQGALPDIELINFKIQDYKALDYYGKLKKMKIMLPKIIHGKEFKEQMSRFLPLDVQENTIEREKYRVMLINELNILFNDISN